MTIKEAAARISSRKGAGAIEEILSPVRCPWAIVRDVTGGDDGERAPGRGEDGADGRGLDGGSTSWFTAGAGMRGGGGRWACRTGLVVRDAEGDPGACVDTVVDRDLVPEGAPGTGDEGPVGRRREGGEGDTGEGGRRVWLGVLGGGTL